MMKILIPVRYPLTDVNVRAIQRGIELAQGYDDPEVIVFHLNEIQSDQHVDRFSLRNAVESRFEGVNASYVIQNGFLFEEAVVEAALTFEVDSIVLSEQRRDRWQRLLNEILGIAETPEQFIRDRTDIVVEVIGTDPESPVI